QTGGDEHCLPVHARFAEDLRVDEQDVAHRQEGGQAGDQLAPDRRVVVGQPEVPVQHAARPLTPPLVHRHAHTSAVRTVTPCQYALRTTTSGAQAGTVISIAGRDEAWWAQPA